MFLDLLRMGVVLRCQRWGLTRRPVPIRGRGCYGNGRLKVILSIYTLGRIYVVIFAEARELYMTVRCQGVGMLYSVQPIYKNPIALASRQVLHSYSIQYV
jgi:hypothetical protein